MSEFDKFSFQLFNESKWLCAQSKNKEEKIKNAYLHASLILSISFLESFINSIAEEFSLRPELSLIEKSLLLEKEIKLNKGEVILSENLKITRLIERIELLYYIFTKKKLQKKINGMSLLSKVFLLEISYYIPKKLLI